MKDRINDFYRSFENIEEFPDAKLVELFVYFLTQRCGKESATSKEVAQCFIECDLPTPKGLAVILSRKTPKILVKAQKGYRLHRTVKDWIDSLNPSEGNDVDLALDLRGHVENISNKRTADFVNEAIECYERGLHRSAIVMSWVGALHLVYDYIINNKLKEFNVEAKRVNDKHKIVKNIDQLAKSMKEGEFLDRIEAIGVISSSEKKGLGECLGRRNSCGHPNNYDYGMRKRMVAHHLETLIVDVFEKF